MEGSNRRHLQEPAQETVRVLSAPGGRTGRTIPEFSGYMDPIGAGDNCQGMSVTSSWHGGIAGGKRGIAGRGARTFVSLPPEFIRNTLLKGWSLQVIPNN